MNDKEFHKLIRRYNIIKHAISLVRDDNKKIQIIEELARVIAYRTRGIYSDVFLDEVLCNIGSKIDVDIEDLPCEGTVLHIITKAGIMGGHTRVVDHWIKIDSERKHSIVITAGAAAKISFPQFLKDTVEESGGRLYFLRSASHISRAKQLLKIAQQFDKIVLHTYMEDAIPVLAFSNKKWKRTIYLYNHANFRFWLGTSITDICLDLTAHDAEISKILRGIENVKVLPIPMVVNNYENTDLRDAIRQYYRISTQNKVITSMANSYKYQSVLDINFFGFIDKLMGKNKNLVFFAIGPGRDEIEWKNLSEKYPDRLHIMGILDRYKVDEILEITDLYLDSFPLASYTSCLDAAVKKIKVVSLETGVAYLDSLKNRAKTPDELVDLIEGILDGSIKYRSDKIEIHLREKWVKRLEGIYNFCPQHRIHKCKGKVRFDRTEKILMSGLDKDNAKYTETWTCHGELPMYDLNDKEYVFPVEMNLWRYLFEKMFKG